MWNVTIPSYAMLITHGVTVHKKCMFYIIELIVVMTGES